MKIFKGLYCNLFGHAHTTPMLQEDENLIYTEACSRCEKPSIWTSTYKNCPPPPNSTEDQIKEFKIFQESKFNKIRNSIK